MRRDEKHRQFRSVSHIAAAHLEQRGYTVLKTATRSLIFDLIAFNTHHTLFISTRRGKGPQTGKQISNTYHELLADMQKTQVPYCTEKQLWVYLPASYGQNNCEFTVYKLFEHGIMKKQVPM